jgi:co-chaperonin GroES (HSP10)
MIKPCNDYLLVELEKPEGIIESGDKIVQRGKVIAVTDGQYAGHDNGTIQLKPVEFQIGDVVIFQKYATADGIFQEDGKDVAFIKQSEIMGRVF